MREEVITVHPDESLLDADKIMRLARIRHLPVVRDGILVGVVSHRDVLESSSDTITLELPNVLDLGSGSSLVAVISGVTDLSGNPLVAQPAPAIVGA